VNAGAEFPLGVVNAFEGVEQMPPQFGEGVRATVGQCILRLGPDTFIGIEFRGIRG